MGRPEKPVNTSGGVATQFARELRELRARAGNPTYREMARSAMFSSSVLSSAASGNRMPSLQVTLAFVAACGGDDEAWRRHWHVATGGYTQPSIGGRTRRPALFQRRGGVPSHPAQLPQRPRGFTGRTTELAWLRSPGDTPMVISGPAGVGKSDLALYYAHSAAADLPDGQLYADLGGLRHGLAGAPAAPEAGDVLDGFLRALGVEDLSGSFDHRAGVYRTLLADRRLLVLLDNVQDEQQVRPLLAETTTSTTLLVSRKRLLGLRDVDRLQLTPLSRGDSIAMITAALPHLAVTAGQDCARLAELCGDLPLALDLAIRKIASRPHLTLRRVVEEWRLNDNTVDWLSVGDLSMRYSLESAYRTLSPPARELLHQLARTPAGTPGSLPPGEDELAEEIADAGLLSHADPYLDGRGLPQPMRAFVLSTIEQQHGHEYRAMAGPVSA
ncbi:helix-turn-helix domain-containing protein [Amycolatopsis sp. WQ 127309]|uniref:helix-turn-helix domain-containing protein n=1 Tax=Amycolatopsis sp. WQ 127309 TaxID=2932773 RepID=UPI001FF2E93E|nr:helix-turn-helix domain-containing protein [Amycolatopsis sp. WQ 127309]UOZ02769.1 NB-ARC domain-containing protein [Amycolatopsis sp. WQ 127309]